MHFPEARVQGYEKLIALAANHPKDRHVLAVALKYRATVIVTSNLKDFPHRAFPGRKSKRCIPTSF